MAKIVGDDQILAFLKTVISNLLPRQHQETVGEWPHFWCSDYWALEVLKCLYMGEATYKREPSPKRLQNNKNFAKIQSIEHTNKKLKAFKHLKAIEDDVDSIVIGEVGWGIDVYLASKIKTWKALRTYDSNYLYEECLKKVFDTYTLNYTFESCKTENFKFNELEGNWVVVCNHSKIKNPEEVMDKNKIKHCIWDGNLIW